MAVALQLETQLLSLLLKESESAFPFSTKGWYTKHIFCVIKSRNMSYDYNEDAGKMDLLRKDLPIIWSIATLAALGATILSQLSWIEFDYGP